jgi:hypothetical protein
MKVQDLARDDDFLSHLLVEKLGTGHIPLLVHKMDPSRRLPKTSPQDLMAIIQRVRFIFPSPLPLASQLLSITLINAFYSLRQLVSVKGSSVAAIHDAVDHLLEFVFSRLSPSFPSQTSSRVKFRLPSVRYFTKGFTEREINSFATFVSPLPFVRHLAEHNQPLSQTQPCVPLYGTLPPNRLD